MEGGRAQRFLGCREEVVCRLDEAVLGRAEGIAARALGALGKEDGVYILRVVRVDRFNLSLSGRSGNCCQGSLLVGN